MFGDHFYHASIRKAVSVFGTIFNNIKVVRTDSSDEVRQIKRVPLAYGPREKFLSRIANKPDFEDPKIAIKMPRMSFEITSISYDSSQKLNRLNKITAASDDPTVRKTVYAATPYKIGMSLSILALNQDDALQIVEQILPYFQPDYTVTINDQTDIGIKSDVPIVLNSVSFEDTYEGDFVSRRAIIYTLEFTMNLKFYGPVSDRNIIQEVNIDINNAETLGFIEEYNATLDSNDSVIEDWDNVDDNE